MIRFPAVPLRGPRAAVPVTLLLALALGACGREGDAGSAPGSANAATTATPDAKTDAKSDAKGASKAEAPAATKAPGGGARGGGSVVLSAADIHRVAKGVIEEGTAVSGNLRPIETVSIKARLEGDLVAVNVRAGDRVSAGATLARLESSEQEAAMLSAEADLAAAKTESQTAQWNLDQTRDLFRAGAIAERDFRTAEQQAASARAREAAAESRVRAASSLVRDTRVLAPVSGTIERREIENGERVSRGAELFTLVRSDVLELAAAVPARRASTLRRGQVVRFTADGRQIEGRVARVSPTIDLASQSVTVYLQVPNANGALKGNAFATGRIIERALDGQLLLPQGAIRQAAGGASPFVWRVVGGTLQNAPVKVGIVDEGRGVVQVLSGIAVGDQIVVGNVGLLGAGMTVQVIGLEARGGPR